MTSKKPKPRIEIPKTWMGVDTKEAYKRIMESDEETSEQENSSIVPMTSSVDYWEIPGVEYRNGVYTVRLAKELLDNGQTKTQDDWIEYSLQAIQNREFYTGSMDLQYQAFKALSKQNNPESEEARDFIRQQMGRKYLMTTTRLRYNPKGEDEVIHDYNMQSQLVVPVGLVDPDRWINKKDSKVLEALLSDSDADSVNEVFNFINGTNAYIWRVNLNPRNIDERVAGFDADSDGAGFYCGRNPSNMNSSLGVFAVAQEKDGEARGYG